jgi:hypothetical protein
MAPWPVDASANFPERISGNGGRVRGAPDEEDPAERVDAATRTPRRGGAQVQ